MDPASNVEGTEPTWCHLQMDGRNDGHKGGCLCVCVCGGGGGGGINLQGMATCISIIQRCM